MKCPLCRINKLFNQKIFIDSNIKCNICLETKHCSNFKLADCGHALCQSCIDMSSGEKRYVSNNVPPTELRDNSLEAIDWLLTYEPNTKIISKYWMNTKEWPSHVVEYIDKNWIKCPKNSHIWPVTAIYYKRDLI